MADRNPTRTPEAGLSGWPGWLRRLLLFAILWWVLTGGAADSWLVGAPVVVAAAWLSLRLWSRPLISPVGLLRFLPWFAWQSLAGAADVALRAFKPELPLYPGLVHHRLRLPPGAPRVMLADVVSMQPGTLSADLLDDELVIHTLDTRHDMHAMVRDMEPRIAAVFGLSLNPETREDAGK